MRALLAAIVTVLPLSAAAAELPAAFAGTWRIANPSDNQCRKDDVKGSAEGHLIVRPGAVERYESSCRIDSVRPTRRDTRRELVSVVADLACEGEGMRWRERSLWHLETLDGKKVTAVTLLSHRQRGGQQGSPADRNALPTTALYVECR